MHVRNKLRVSIPSEALMSRIIIANIHFQIILQTFHAQNATKKMYWVTSRNTYLSSHTLLCGMWMLLLCSFAHSNTKHMRIKSSRIYRWAGWSRCRVSLQRQSRLKAAPFIPMTNHTADQAPPGKHNTDRLTKQCCLKLHNKYMQLLYLFCPTKTTTDCALYSLKMSRHI